MNSTLRPLLLGTIVLIGFMSSQVYADRIVVFGASGQFGTKVVREALDRGHQVIGVSRSPENFSYMEESFIGVGGNPTVLESVEEITRDADSIIVALGDREAVTPETTAMNLAAVALSTALDGLGRTGPPVIVLGGGNTSADDKDGMLEILASRGGDNNRRLTMIFLSQWETYQTYKQSNINWTYVATPQIILGVTNDGDTARTGKYRVSTDGSLDREQNTGLSRADIAAAMVDFAESGEFSQMRVTVAQEQPAN